MKRIVLILSVLLGLGAVAKAQSSRDFDFGTMLSAKFSANLKHNLSIGAEEELRFNQNSTQFNRWLNGVNVSYSFLHNRMEIGLNLEYIRRSNKDYYCENRGRIGLDLSYSETFRRFKFTYRSRFNSTFMDETTGEHRVNPKLYWRNKFQVSYQRPNSRFKYTLSAELFWLLNDPKQCIIDNIRTTLLVDYRIARRHSIALMLRNNNDIQVKNPVSIFYLGLQYRMKL